MCKSIFKLGNMGEQALKSHANGKIHKKFVCVREIHMYFDKMSVRKVYFSGCLSGENTRILINVREIFDKFWLRTLFHVPSNYISFHVGNCSLTDLSMLVHAYLNSNYAQISCWSVYIHEISTSDMKFHVCLFDRHENRPDMSSI